MCSNYYYRPTEEEERQIVTTTTTATLPPLPMFERPNFHNGLGNNGCYYYDNCVECDSSSGDKESVEKLQDFTPLVPMLQPTYPHSLQPQQSQLLNDVFTVVNRVYKVEMDEEMELKEGDSYSTGMLENCPSTPASLTPTPTEEQVTPSASTAVAPDSQAQDGNDKHKCLICSKTFKRKIWLEVHSCKHSGHETFQCPHCPKKFKFKSLLDLHSIKHCDIRNFPCTLCDKKFKTKYQLKQHTNVSHSDLKRFECCYCQKKFKRKNQLLLHTSNTHPNMSPRN